MGETPRLPYTHAYLAGEGIDERRIVGDWLVLRVGKGLAALHATSPLVAVENGPGAGREFRAQGTRIGWIVVLADSKSVDQFADELSRTEVGFDPAARRLAFLTAGGTQLLLDYADGLTVDNEPYRFPNPTVSPFAVFSLAR